MQYLITYIVLSAEQYPYSCRRSFKQYITFENYQRKHNACTKTTWSTQNSLIMHYEKLKALKMYVQISPGTQKNGLNCRKKLKKQNLSLVFKQTLHKWKITVQIQPIIYKTWIYYETDMYIYKAFNRIRNMSVLARTFCSTSV